jgi:hypothetical protein
MRFIFFVEIDILPNVGRDFGSFLEPKKEPKKTKRAKKEPRRAKKEPNFGSHLALF